MNSVADKGRVGNSAAHLRRTTVHNCANPRLPQGRFAVQCQSAVAENQPANKNRMNQELSDFAARLRERIPIFSDVAADVRRLKFQKPATGTSNQSEPTHVGCYEDEFSALALELFALQLKFNPAYRKICAGRKLMPGAVEHWTEIPVVPTAVFKELELTSIPPAERTAVFHSSGTTEQKPSRHFHSAESLNVYETSLLAWFAPNVWPDLRFTIYDLRTDGKSALRTPHSAIFLTPPPEQAPHSSLVHMFETIRSRACESADHSFFGTVASDGSWTLDFDAVVAALNSSLVTRLPAEASAKAGHPSLLLGTAFSFVHLLDYLQENNLRFQLPPGSRVMETGGYKGRSRSMPKAELHALITARLGIPPENIICEYGMSELSSQAYDGVASDEWRVTGKGSAPRHPSPVTRHFSFPPWARVQIISPETGGEVAEGETGLIRVFDLANVFSVLAVQTEDVGIRRGDGFELIGRAALAEARGCSLMTV
jgi:hypothetical protein